VLLTSPPSADSTTTLSAGMVSGCQRAGGLVAEFTATSGSGAVGVFADVVGALGAVPGARSAGGCGFGSGAPVGIMTTRDATELLTDMRRSLVVPKLLRYNDNGAAVPGSQVSCGGAITCALRIAISPTSALTPRWKSAYPRSGRPVPHRNPLAVLLRSPELWRGSSHVRACSRVDVLSRESSGFQRCTRCGIACWAVTTWVFRLRSTYRRQPS